MSKPTTTFFDNQVTGGERVTKLQVTVAPVEQQVVFLLERADGKVQALQFNDITFLKFLANLQEGIEELDSIAELKQQLQPNVVDESEMN